MAGNDDSTRGQWMRRWRRRRWAAGTNRRRRREGCERIRGCRHSAEGCSERGTHPAAGCSRRGSPPGASPKRSSGHSGQLRYCDDHVSSRWLAAAQPRRRRIRRPSVPQPCPVPSPPPPRPSPSTVANQRCGQGPSWRGGARFVDCFTSKVAHHVGSLCTTTERFSSAEIEEDTGASHSSL